MLSTGDVTDRGKMGAVSAEVRVGRRYGSGP